MQSSAGKIKGNVTASFSAVQPQSTLSLAIGDEIGRGSTSVVCTGRVEDWEEDVAVKILRPSLVSSPAEERFVREAELLCRLSHPNIVRGLGMGVLARGEGMGGVPFLVIELVAGPSLDILIAHHTLAGSPRKALELLLGISSALGYLHLDGRVQAHRDVKPANIMVCPDGTPKLVDLGVAKTVLISGKSLETRLAGTIRYMPPEQMADSSRVDIRSDIYSLGIVLLEMLGCGGRWASDERELLTARFSRTPPRLSTSDAGRLGLTGNQRTAIDGLLVRMCAYEPHDRFQTPGELSHAIQDVLEDLAGDSSREGKPPRRLLPSRTGVILCAACLTIAGLMMLAQHPSKEGGIRTQPPPGREIVITDEPEGRAETPDQQGSSPVNGGM